MALPPAGASVAISLVEWNALLCEYRNPPKMVSKTADAEVPMMIDFE